MHLRTIGSTCARFRTVLLNSPRCWTFIEVPDNNQNQKLFDALEVRLNRSQNCQLDLNILSGAVLRDIAASIMAPHMNRCRSILFSDERDAQEAASTIFAGAQLSSLQHLSFYAFYDGPEADRNLDQRHVMLPGEDSILQPLVSLSLNSRSTSLAIPTVFLSLERLSMDSLTRLCVCGSMDGLFMIRMLRRCTKLEHLRWESPFYMPGERDLAMLHLPYFKTLVLRRANTYTHMPPLIAPLLEQVIIYEPGDINWEPQPVSIFIPQQPHLPSLRRLEMHRISHISHSSIIAFVQRHPGIQELSLFDDFSDSSHWLSSFLDALAFSTLPNGEPRDSDLSSLSVCTLMDDFDTPEAVVAIEALRRLLLVRPHITIHWISTVTGVSLDEIEELQDEFPQSVKITSPGFLELIKMIKESVWPQAWSWWR